MRLRRVIEHMRRRVRKNSLAADGYPPSVARFASQFDDARVEAESENHVYPPSVAFIGRDQTAGLGALRISGALTDEPFQSRAFKVVSFHTDDEIYSRHAANLIESAAKVGVNIEVQTIPGIGKWELNCAYKARFIRDAWEASTLPVVWVDADATFESYPSLFGTIEADFAIHRWEGWQFASGTLYFERTDLARSLLDAWVMRCESDPTLWDQTHLDSAWADVSAVMPLRTLWLPRSYCQIAGTPELEPSIIKHWQASRVEKRQGRSIFAEPPTTYSSSGVSIRQKPALWRSPTQAFWIAEGNLHIKPEIGEEFPEGFDVAQALRDSLKGVRPVLEIGCGVGRLAALFSSAEYLGVDINPKAVKAARERLPQHNIHVHDVGMNFPTAPAALVYTMLLHVPDDEFSDRLTEIVDGRELVVIAELMDPKWRRDGDPPVFNRRPEEYVAAMRELGYLEIDRSVHLYERYRGTRVANPDITFLTFKKSG